MRHQLLVVEGAEEALVAGEGEIELGPLKTGRRVVEEEEGRVEEDRGVCRAGQEMSVGESQGGDKGASYRIHDSCRTQRRNDSWSLMMSDGKCLQDWSSSV